MKTIRPMQVSVCSRVLEQGHRFHSIHSASMGLRIPSGEPLLDLDFLKEALGALGPGDLPDTGMPKPQGEVLLTGAFHSPGGRPVPGHEVLFRVGPVERRLFVFGPRRWGPLAPTDPQPIASCPLDEAHAFGGAGFAPNPAGLGCGDGQLPWVEDPRHLVASTGDRPEPAFPGPAGPAHPRRMAFQPRYGPEYLHQDHPGYPAGFDWRYFLCGPPEQRLPGFFRGDESYAFHHLHPEQEVLQGRLPGFRVRVFLNQDLGGAGPQFSELPMNLDTVWCFPAQRLLWLFWRGGREVADDEASQITHLLAAFESPQAPRTLDHYRQALALRLEARDPLLDALNTQDLIPPDQPCALERLTSRAQAPSGAFSRNMAVRKDQLLAMAGEKLDSALAEAGRAVAAEPLPEALAFDLGTLRPPAAQPAADLGAGAVQDQLEKLLPGSGQGGPVQLKDFSFRKLEELMETVGGLTRSKKAELLAHTEATQAGALAGVRGQDRAGLPGELQRALDAAARTLEEGAAPAKAPLPRFDPRPILDALAGAEAQARAGVDDMAARPGAQAGAAALGTTVDGLEPARLQIQESLGKAEAAFKPLYLRGAHRMPEGASPHAEDLPTRRAAFLRALAQGTSPAQGDWACLDLAGLRLDGADLAGAYLEQVDLRGASLRGASLRGAILARARLEGADCTGADLEGANLGGAQAAGARFAGANLQGATLELGTFTGADFQGCRLQEATLMEVRLDQADFSGAFLASSTFLKLELTGTRFRDAHLDRATFLQCVLRRVDCSGAQLDHSTWTDPRLEEVRFDGAALEAACFLATAPGGAALAGLSFAGARLDRGTFMGATLTGTDFRGASLAGALFTGADLSRADLSGARARQAQFRKAVLTGANLERIDLMDGSLAKANLVQARFRGANLHGVDFLRCTLGATDFTDCNLERTLLQHWRPR